MTFHIHTATEWFSNQHTYVPHWRAVQFDICLPPMEEKTNATDTNAIYISSSIE